MQHCRSVATPMDPDSERTVELEFTDRGFSFQELVGNLYLPVPTRPDNTFGSTLVSYMKGPSKVHVNAAKCFLKHVQGTISTG